MADIINSVDRSLDMYIYDLYIYIDIYLSIYLSVYLSLSILFGRHLCQCGASRQQKPTSCRYDTYAQRCGAGGCRREATWIKPAKLPHVRCNISCTLENIESAEQLLFQDCSLLCRQSCPRHSHQPCVSRWMQLPEERKQNRNSAKHEVYHHIHSTFYMQCKWETSKTLAKMHLFQTLCLLLSCHCPRFCHQLCVWRVWRRMCSATCHVH